MKIPEKRAQLRTKLSLGSYRHTDTNQMLRTNEVITGDCRTLARTLVGNSVAACITDPPYNYEFIGREWDEREIKRRITRVKSSKTLVKNIPYGSGLAGGVRNPRWYGKVRENILEYEAWCYEWGNEIYRVLKPGGFALVFNSTRSFAHVQVALERAGFYARDCFVWKRHSGIPKGLNISKKLATTGDLSAPQWEGWHSCLRNEWEAICAVQKPLLNNYVETVQKSGVGLFRAVRSDGKFQSNILEGFGRSDGDAQSGHCTTKPLELMRFLVDLVVPPGAGNVVLDPFAGTGTTLVAAKSLGRSYIGFEINADYAEIARKRLDDLPGEPVDSERSGSRVQPVLQFEAG
jgi:site-specific DNA-methyltransferase (adenine-specific)